MTMLQNKTAQWSHVFAGVLLCTLVKLLGDRLNCDRSIILVHACEMFHNYSYSNLLK